MNDLLIQRRMQMPVVTGVPANLESVHGSEVQAGSSFQEVLAQAANKTAEISLPSMLLDEWQSGASSFPAPEWSGWRKDFDWRAKRA